MKERAIICIVLLVLTYAVCGCDEEKGNLEYMEWDCVCGEHLSCTYIKPYYWFECIKCGVIKTNTECDTVNEFYELVGFKEIYVELTKPNEASYKAWFGWE